MQKKAQGTAEEVEEENPKIDGDNMKKIRKETGLQDSLEDKRKQKKMMGNSG